MTEINWGLLADFGEYDAPELEKRQRIRDALAAREREQREQAQQSAQNAAQSNPPPLAQPAAKTQGLRYPSAPSDASVMASSYAAPVDQLAAAVDAAPDDAARARLLDAAPRDVRQAFRAMLAYRKLSEADPPDAHAAFDARLAAAASDDERRLLFAATDPAFLRGWRWRRTATADDWARRFLALANPAEADY